MQLTINQYKKNESKLEEYENKLVLLTSEIERLTNVINIQSKEIENWFLIIIIYINFKQLKQYIIIM